MQKEYGKGRRKGGLQCTFFIQERGGDDAEGVRKGEEEGRFTVYFFHSGMGLEMMQKEYGKGRRKGGLQCTFFIQERGGDDAEGVRKGEDCSLHLNPCLLTVLDVPLW